VSECLGECIPHFRGTCGGTLSHGAVYEDLLGHALAKIHDLEEQLEPQEESDGDPEEVPVEEMEGDEPVEEESDDDVGISTYFLNYKATKKPEWQRKRVREVGS
jgi:hypothetical protein